MPSPFSSFVPPLPVTVPALVAHPNLCLLPLSRCPSQPCYSCLPFRAHLYHRRRCPQCSASPSVEPPRRSRRSRRGGRRRQFESLYTRAREHMQRGEYAAAREMLRKGARDEPYEGRNWVAWGRLEGALGNVDKAREVFRRGHEKLPVNGFILHAWAGLEEGEGNFDRCRELLELALESNPRDGLLYQAFALVEAKAGRTERARKLFQMGVQQDAENASVRSAWGTFELREGNLYRAIELLQQSVECDPTHLRSYHSWAIAAAKLQDFATAERLYKKALAIDPTSAPTFQAYGLLCKDLGRIDEARKLFQRGLEQSGADDVSILHAWAKLEHEQGNTAQARNLYNRGIEIAPQSTAVLRAWAAMELELGHIDKSSDWQVPPGMRPHHASARASSTRSPQKGGFRNKQISIVGENLQMLRRLIERRTEDDIRIVLKWLGERAAKDVALRDQVTKRGSEDARRVLEWAERRSKEDIAKFDEWVARRYEQDRRIGVYLLNLNIEPLRESPKEWLRLSEAPEKPLHYFDENIYIRDEVIDYADFVYWLGSLANGLADRAALTAMLGALSLFLVMMNVQWNNHEYFLGGVQEESKAIQLAPPSGVDAHLIQHDFENGEAFNLDFPKKK